MAASAWRVYRELKDNLAKKVVNLDTDAIKCALFLSTSNCGDVALVTAQYAILTNQHANANGYLTGGITVAATWATAAGVSTFDAADPVWSATGGPITARFAILYSDTATNKDLIAYCILDDTPANVTAINGYEFVIQIDANGVFTLSGGEA